MENSIHSVVIQILNKNLLLYIIGLANLYDHVYLCIESNRHNPTKDLNDNRLNPTKGLNCKRPTIYKRPSYSQKT